MLENSNEWHHVVTMEDLGDLKRKFHVVYDVEGVQMALDKSLDIISSRAQVKGFRKGKAPKPLVRSHFRKEIESSASSLLTQEGFLHACFEQKIQPLGEPKIEDAEFNLDGTFSCDIILEIKPQIEPSGYVGMKLTKPEINRDEIFNRMLKQTKQEHAKEIEVNSVSMGSVVSLDFKAVLESGTILTEGSDHYFVITEGQGPPFGENLIGKAVEEEFEESIVLPEINEHHAGEKVSVKGIIKSIVEKVDPTNEELAESTKAPSYEKLEEVLHSYAEQEATNKEKQQIEEEIVDKLIEGHSFDVPKKWVEDEEKYLTSQLNLQGELNSEVKKQITYMAERNVRRTFILEAIYDAEPSLKVSKEELETWLEREADQRQVSVLTLKKDLKEQNMLEGVLGLVKHRKVLNFIISQAQVGEEVNNEESYEIPENPLG